jgi:transposase-like protein
MKRWHWDAKTKATIVVQGLQGRPVAEICHEYQISPSLSYQWRDPCLAHAAHAFEVHQHCRGRARLEHENAKLKKLGGELLVELKTSDEGLS